MCQLLFTRKNFDLSRVTKYPFKTNFICSKYCSIQILLECCTILIVFYKLFAVVLFSRIFIVGQHCNDNCFFEIFRSSIFVFWSFIFEPKFNTYKPRLFENNGFLNLRKRLRFSTFRVLEMIRCSRHQMRRLRHKMSLLYR